MTNRTFSPGMLIFREGDTSEQAYLIHSGTVELLKGYPDHPVSIARVEPGEILGEMGLA